LMANVAFAYVDSCTILYQVILAAGSLMTFQTNILKLIVLSTL